MITENTTVLFLNYTLLFFSLFSAVVAWRLREEVRLSKEVNLLKFVAVGPATNGGQTTIMKPRVVTSKIKT